MKKVHHYFNIFVKCQIMKYLFFVGLSRVNNDQMCLGLEGCRNFLLANKYHSKDKILIEMTRRYRI